MSVDVEHERTDALFTRIEQIEGVADTLPTADPRRRTLQAVVEDELAAANPVRPVIAASLLGLTEKTVRAWVDEGVLVARTTSPRLLLDPARLNEVRRVVRELQAAGKNRRLLDEVYRRLADAALRDRQDLQQAITEMRHGRGRIVRGAA